MWTSNTPVNLDAPDAFVAALVAAGVAHELRQHEPARHARHLAAIWDRPLHAAGRATLFLAAGAAPATAEPNASNGIGTLAVSSTGSPVVVLVVIPADRKVAAPRLRDLLRASELRVLRGDRGVGRVGWQGLPGEPGALPAVPGLFSAPALVEAELLDHPEVLLTIAPGRSMALAPAAYASVVGAATAHFAGRTRLLTEGGMVRDPEAKENPRGVTPRG